MDRNKQKNEEKSPKGRYKAALGGYSKVSDENSDLLFDNLIWLTTKETAMYLRKSVNSIHQLVSKKKLRARKFCNRLYFNKKEIDYMIETSQFRGG